MKNNKGQVAVVIIILLLTVIAGAVIWFAVTSGGQPTTTQQIISTPSTPSTPSTEIVQATKSGDVASIGVYVRDVANDNVNTKVAVATYCQDNAGNFIIDATASSTSAEITGTTTIGKTITCWAFNTTYQTLEPAVVTVDEEAEHIVIDAYKVGTSAHLQAYNDQYATGTAGALNISLGANQQDSFQKIRFTNNNTNKNIPLGGFYFNVIENTNISNIDVVGSATLSGMDHSSTSIVDSDLSTDVSSRKTNWDYVFEIDDDATKEGNNALLLEENDYLETGSVSVTADGDGCNGVSDLISSYAFTKGFYRSQVENSVNYGSESDAITPSVISADLTGDTWYCTA